MFNTLTFPETMDEFIEQYKVVKEENLYCDGVEFIPVFRMKEWVERIQPQKREWIPITHNINSFPIRNKSILLCTKYGGVMEGHFEGYNGFHKIWKSGGTTYWDEEIKAWMPLPEPYKENKK